MHILEEYVKGGDELSEDSIVTAIQEVIGQMRTKEMDVNRGNVMKALIGPGGTLSERGADNSQVARLVGGML